MLDTKRVYVRNGEGYDSKTNGGGLTSTLMNEARVSHLPFWGPSEAVLILIKRPSGSPE